MIRIQRGPIDVGPVTMGYRLETTARPLFTKWMAQPARRVPVSKVARPSTRPIAVATTT